MIIDDRFFQLIDIFCAQVCMETITINQIQFRWFNLVKFIQPKMQEKTQKCPNIEEIQENGDQLNGEEVSLAANE